MIKSKINLLKSIIYQIFSGFNISNIINLLYNEGRGSDDGIKPVSGVYYDLHPNDPDIMSSAFTEMRGDMCTC